MSVLPFPHSDCVQVARCPVHGLHGERQECFVCGGPVEQVEMIEAARVDAWLAQWKIACDALAERLTEVATIAPAGTKWPRFEVPREHRVYAIIAFGGVNVVAGGADVEEARAALKAALLIAAADATEAAA